MLDDIAGPDPKHVKHFSLDNSFAATMTPQQAQTLASDPRVAAVVPDVPLAMPDPGPTAATRAPGAIQGLSAPHDGLAGGLSATSDKLCPDDPSKPLVEPEALESINAYTTDGSPNAQELVDGSGVTVAFLGPWDGMDPDHPNFIRPNGEHVFVDYQDFSGLGPSAIYDGREAYGDASSIAAQGTVVHDLSTFVPEWRALPAGCNIVIRGVAPGASLVGLSYHSLASLMQAIDYAVTVDHVDVINESFANYAIPDDGARLALNAFNDAAVDAGVTVTALTGDAGWTGTIGAGTDPKVITLGATTDYRFAAQSGVAAFGISNGQWLRDNIATFSSGGFSESGGVADLVAPGEWNWADCDPAYTGCTDYRSSEQPSSLQVFGGTSESAPLTAGVAALVIEAYRSTHDGDSPTPALVKQLVTGTARDLGMPAEEQGAGLLDARAAVEAAMTYPAGHAAGHTADPALGSHLVTSVDQLTLIGKPGEKKSGHVTLTNSGTEPVTVEAGARELVPLASSHQTVQIPAGHSGLAVPFDVPSGAQRLLVQMAHEQPTADDLLFVALRDPAGRYAGFSEPQAGLWGDISPYANLDVRSPAAGTWTAVILSPRPDYAYRGDIDLQFSTQRAQPTATVHPSTFRLAPGASKHVDVQLTLPTASGDVSRSITFAGSNGQHGSVSAVLRTLVDIDRGGQFDGVVTGGNGRHLAPAQSSTYAFDVRPGHRDLAVALQLTDDADVVDTVLIDPNGEAVDVASNIYVDEDYGLSQSPTVQMFQPDPVPGRWRLMVLVQNPVAGNALEKPYHGTVTYDAVDAHSSDLPTSPKSVLKAGQPYTAHVVVHNTGVQPLTLGVDPRLDKQQDLALDPTFGPAAFDLPAGLDASSFYVVPPDTSAITTEARSTVPAQVELATYAGGIDVFGDLDEAQEGATDSVARVSEARGFVTPGVWSVRVDELGPYSDDGPAPGSTELHTTLRTAPFDTTVSSDTDDPYRIVVDPTADGFGAPVVLAPGNSASITVHIVPNGPRGRTVTGHLNLVTEWGEPAGPWSPWYTTGESVATIPYTYKIG